MILVFLTIDLRHWKNRQNYISFYIFFILLFTRLINCYNKGYKLNFLTKFCDTVNLRVYLLQDCDHVSQTAEEFYTVRCQVADMKNIYVSPTDLLRRNSESNKATFTHLE